ncbi:hypothetical protein PoB_004923400 [Plakobranchus ocellatus]|uniref:Uncharacterized protein n=1 Tax=Plakobranchus ocellatus TaxID=259542 RepID=A0AAV4BRD7_9GAST|nr:hypothetical protein PoB_004923400 [Plakobranchus ocellatus]
MDPSLLAELGLTTMSAPVVDQPIARSCDLASKAVMKLRGGDAGLSRISLVENEVRLFYFSFSNGVACYGSLGQASCSPKSAWVM